jgi:fumarate reductase flavoprotein subunit
MTQNPIEVRSPLEGYDIQCDTLIIGAGACGLVASLAAHEQGQSVLVVERDVIPRGSTALSAGLIPAAGTKFQHEAGITDSPEIFAADIQHKAKNENDQAIVDLLAENAGKVIEWLEETHDLAFSVVTDFDYPGHSHRRMHGLPTRSGAELIDALRTACETAEIDIICERHAQHLYFDGHKITGASVIGPDGQSETIACQKLILACNGFGGNRALVAQHMPDIHDALWFGHDGNQGEAIDWAKRA